MTQKPIDDRDQFYVSDTDTLKLRTINIDDGTVIFDVVEKPGGWVRINPNGLTLLEGGRV